MYLIETKMQKPGCIVYRCREKGKTLRNILEDELKMSSRFMSKLKKTKSIYVNGKFQKFDYKVRLEDIVKIFMDEEESEFEPQNMNIQIEYEDFDMAVVKKPPFMVVHPTKSHEDGTLANAIASHFKSNGEKIRIRFANRLDMNTSGLVMIVKNPYAHHMISKEMEIGGVVKKYMAIVEGVVESDSGSIDAPIYKSEDEKVMRIVDQRGQRALSHYKVVERYEDATLLEVRIETGRTHQIRVHMKHMGHPIIGDDVYGTAFGKDLIDRQALHATSLRFNQPRTGERISVESEISKDMKELIQKLKKRG